MSNNTPPTVNSYPDWVSLFGGIQRNAQIPGTSATEIGINQNDALFRDMYIDLSDVQNKISASGFKPFSVTIYADVVHIPADLLWTLNSSALTIAARRIEVAGEAQVVLDVRKTDTAALVIFANEVVGSLQAVTTTPKGASQPISITNVSAQGTVLSVSNGTLTQQTMAGTQGPMLQDGSDFYSSLITIFQFASILSQTHPDIAAAQCEWIKGAAANSHEPMMVNLCLQGAAMQALLSSSAQASVQGAISAQDLAQRIFFVPKLSKDVYIDLAKTYADAAQDYETQYNRFSDKNEQIEARIQAAKMMLANSQDQTGYVDGLIQQCQGNLDQATSAVETAKTNLQSQQSIIQDAQQEFQKGLEEYERAQKLDAALQVAQATVTFGTSIGLMFVGDEAAGIGAVNSAIEGVKGISQAVDSTKNIMQIAKDVCDAMQKIKDLQTVLTPLIEFSQKIKEATQNFDNAGNMTKELASIDITTGDTDITSTDYWEIFKIKADVALQDAVNKGIGGAADYQTQLHILTVYGQSLTSCQVAVVNLSQELVRLMLQKQVSTQQSARLSTAVDNMSASEEPNTEMMQMFYQHYLDSKRSLFVAFKSYQLAYQYWALRPSGISPVLTSTIGQLDTDINKMTSTSMDEKQALETLSPVPQPVNSLVYEVTDPNVLQSLKTNLAASWPIPLKSTDGSDVFAGWNRFRFTTVRIWLIGANTLKSIYIQLSSSGIYRDRYKGKEYQFVSPLGSEVDRIFQYQLAASSQRADDWPLGSGQYGQILGDGTASKDFESAYFVPTPFSDWTITLPKDLNPGLDLSGLTKIQMVFSGSAMGNSTRSTSTL